MKIQKMINIAENQINKQKLINKNNLINKYVKIHDVNTYGDSFNQMYNAREVMANYAKNNGVSIDIYDAKKLLDDDESVSPIIENDFSDKLNVIVTNLLNGKSKAKIVSANTDKTYPKIAEVPIVLTSDNIEHMRKGIRRTEDSFIRNLFRNIENLTNYVTGKNSK